MKKLVLASGNAGKLREFGQLLARFDFEVVPQSAFDVPEAAEPHITFVENALAKARHAAELTGLPALADDSGLCVTALGGAPGVFSAHYAGEPRSDQRNNAKLLADLDGVADRRAHYVAVLVLLRSASDPQPVIAQGEWHGEIIDAPKDGETSTPQPPCGCGAVASMAPPVSGAEPIVFTSAGLVDFAEVRDLIPGRGIAAPPPPSTGPPAII
jgi:XTP/dITP diphosphohydrolase